MGRKERGKGREERRNEGIHNGGRERKGKEVVDEIIQEKHTKKERLGRGRERKEVKNNKQRKV